LVAPQAPPAGGQWEPRGLAVSRPMGGRSAGARMTGADWPLPGQRGAHWRAGGRHGGGEGRKEGADWRVLLVIVGAVERELIGSCRDGGEGGRKLIGGNNGNEAGVRELIGGGGAGRKELIGGTVAVG